MSDKNKDAWDDVLGEAPQKESEGIPPDLARKLLELNPALREAGEDTMGLVKKSQKAQQQPKTAAPSSAARIGDAMAEGKAELDREEKRLDADAARLQKERDALSRATFEQVCRWLQTHDADLRSPVTQQALADERAFLDAIGFNVKTYMAHQKKGAR